MTNMTKIIVAGLILGVGLGLWLFKAGTDTQSMPAKNTDTQVSKPIDVTGPQQDWPLYRGSQGLLGVSSETLPETLSLLWSFKTAGPVRSSAVIQDGRVFIGSADKNLYALDSTTGKKIWAFTADSPIEAPPTIIGDTVVVGDLGGMVYAVDAQSGEKVWTYETEGEISGAVNWARLGERLCVLISSHDNYIHCVDALTGDRVWQFETQNWINGAPAVSQGMCVFGGCDASIYVLRLADANEVTHIDTGAYVACSVVFDQDRVYAGNYEGLFLSASISEPNEKWEYPIEDGQIVSSAAVTQDCVVFGDRSMQVLCLDRHTGKLRWTFKTLDNVDSSPVVAGDKVVVGSDDGRIYMLNLETGKKLWSYELGKPIISSPAVSHGRVVIGCDDGSVYAFGR